MGEKYLRERGEAALVWPYKVSKEDKALNEAFYGDSL